MEYLISDEDEEFEEDGIRVVVKAKVRHNFPGIWLLPNNHDYATPHSLSFACGR